MSAIGALVYSRRSGRARVLLLFQPGAVRTPGVLRFLRHLRRHTRGRTVLLWDGLHAHRAAPVTQWLAQNSHWLKAEGRLPAYAPELNPVEGLWGWPKGNCLANVCTDDLGPVPRVRCGARRVRRRPALLRGFLAHAALSL